MSRAIPAQITAAPGKENLVPVELAKLVAIIRSKNGCLQYDLPIVGRFRRKR